MPASNRTLSLTTDRLQVSFGSDPFVIRRIINRLTGRTVCLNGKQSFLLRTLLDVSEPIFMDRCRSFGSSPDGIRFIVTDATGKYTLTVTVVEAGGEIRFGLRAVAPLPVWMVEWQISGLRLKEVIVPALGGQSISDQMPDGNTLSYKYPFWWNARFVIGRMEKGGIWFHRKHTGPDFVLLRVKKESNGFAITCSAEAAAPVRSTSLETEWSVDAFEGSWKVPVGRYRQWMEEAYRLKPLSANRRAPAWLENISFVLELWGMRKDRPQPHHTFDEMKRRITEWARLYPPGKTLLYLPGYANQGIDSKAPNYDPSPFLGGERKFGELVARAHALGYRVMIHTNVLAMTFSHPLYRKFKKHQVDDPFGRPMTWGLDMDGDWLAEPYFAYINPGAKEWGRLMTGILGKLIRKYRLDAVFLDQTLLAFNNSRGPDFLGGMREHVGRLHRAFPDVLFAGEGLHEQIVSQLPMAQIHGIDSITEVHGLEGAASWRRIHPVSVFLFGKYTKFVPHLLTRHPSHRMFRFQERSYAKLGILPALCLYENTQRMDCPAVRAMIARVSEIYDSSLRYRE